MIADPIAALIDFLRAQLAVSERAGARIFGGELPDVLLNAMPRPCITLRPVGGSGQLDSGYLEVGDPRVDVVCYGASPYDAWQLHATTFGVLKQMRRNVQGRTVLHCATPAGGPTANRDPDTEWPLVLSTWQVLYSEKEVAA